MEENTEVSMDGKRYLWDGGNWCDPQTYMEPPESIVSKLNGTFRKEEMMVSPKRGGTAVKRPTAKRTAAGAASFRTKSLSKAATPPPPPSVERLSSYTGENAFLAIDAPSPVELDGQQFPSILLAMEAAKSLHDRLRLNMQREWDEEKRVPLMKRLLRSKFAHPQMRTALLGTAEKYLAHTDSGADSFWHAPDGKGENTLGKLLMELRATMRKPYYLLKDEQIVEHLREYRLDHLLVPDEALLHARSWKHITELCELYKADLSPDVMTLLNQRRVELQAVAKA